MGVEQILATMKGAEDVQNGLGRIGSAAASAGSVVARLSTSISGASFAANNAIDVLKVVEEKTGLVGKDVLRIANGAQEALLLASRAAQTFNIARSAFAADEALKVGAAGSTAAAGITIAGLLFLVKAQAEEFRRRFDATPKKEDLDRLDKLVQEMLKKQGASDRDKLTSDEAKRARMALAVRREVVTMRGETFHPDLAAQRLAERDLRDEFTDVDEVMASLARNAALRARAEADRAAVGSKD